MRKKCFCLATLALFVLVSKCEAVQYRLTFDATWSDTSHPNAFAGPAAHFSPLVGTLHNEAVSFWEPGSTATRGLENVAELGSTGMFVSELNSAVDLGDAYQIIRGANLNSPGTERHTFEAVPEFSRITLATMIAPSSDWFAGVSALPLRQNDQWRKTFEIDLHPYDAGTENGSSFSLNNPPTTPPKPIRRLDLDNSSVFFESEPLGTFRFELMPLCDLNLDGKCDLVDLNSTSGLYSAGDLVTGVDVIVGTNSKFDLTEDGRVDGADLDLWLAEAADHNGFAEPYLKGDTNLNDHVGFGDFLSMASGFGVGVEWSDGNYDGSSEMTSFTDFLSLAGNFGKSIRRKSLAQNVPEGRGTFPLLLTVVLIHWLRRQRV